MSKYWRKAKKAAKAVTNVVASSVAVATSKPSTGITNSRLGRSADDPGSEVARSAASAKAAADKVIADKVIADKVIADKAIADKAAAVDKAKAVDKVVDKKAKTTQRKKSLLSFTPSSALKSTGSSGVLGKAKTSKRRLLA
jgi:hypothetical protein